MSIYSYGRANSPKECAWEHSPLICDFLKIQQGPGRAYYRRLSICQFNQYNYKYWDVFVNSTNLTTNIETARCLISFSAPFLFHFRDWDCSWSNSFLSRLYIIHPCQNCTSHPSSLLTSTSCALSWPTKSPKSRPNFSFCRETRNKTHKSKFWQLYAFWPFFIGSDLWLPLPTPTLSL